MTDAAPPQTATPTEPSSIALLTAYDLVTRYRLRLVDQRDSRLAGLDRQYQLAAAAWTGDRSAFVGFYEPPADPVEAGHDLAARCEAARRWGHERLQVQGAKRCDILLVALRPVSGSLNAATTQSDPVSVGAVWVDVERGEADAILPPPPGTPSVQELRARVRSIREGASPPTLAAVDLAERQTVAGGYSQPVQRQLITQPVVTYGLIASFVAIYLLEVLLIRSQQFDICISSPCAAGLPAFGALPNGDIDSTSWWRLVSSSFLHDNSSPFHVGFNALAMLWIGRLVEQLYGRLVLLGTFLITAVAGGLVWLGVSATGLLPGNGLAIGASGGIMGLVGLLLMLGRLQGRSVPVGIAFGIRRYAVSVILLTLAFGFLFHNVNNVAHIGGLAAGVIVGAVLPPLRRIGGRELRAAEKGVLAAVIGASAVALVFAIANLASVLQTGATLV